jgi:hypothetical protein
VLNFGNNQLVINLLPKKLQILMRKKGKGKLRKEKNKVRKVESKPKRYCYDK